MKTTKIINRLIDLALEHPMVNWNRLDWKRQVDKELQEMINSQLELFEHKFIELIDEAKIKSLKPNEFGAKRTGDYRIGLEKAKDLFDNAKCEIKKIHGGHKIN